MTKASFENLRRISPKALYVFADGPRPDRPEDLMKVLEVREIVSNIDWDCSAKFYFSESNKGLTRSLEEGLDLVFSENTFAFILEDDCLVEKQFFQFVNEVISEEFEQNHPEVAMFSAYNPVSKLGKSFTFHKTKSANIWGWATWSRVWTLYRQCDSGYSWTPSEISDIASTFKLRARSKAFQTLLKQGEQLQTWDVRWHYWFRSRDLRSAQVSRNMVVNYGFDEDATHTKIYDPRLPVVHTRYRDHLLPVQIRGRDESMWDECLQLVVPFIRAMFWVVRNPAGFIQLAGEHLKATSERKQ